MADVDEIWLEMQREQGGTTYPRKTKVQDLSLLQKEKTKAKRGAKRMDSSLNWMSSWSATLKPTEHQVEAFLGGPAMAVVEPPTTMVDALEELPTGTPEIFLAYIQRDINCLSEENLSVRLQSLQKLERVLVKQIDSLATDIVDAVVDALLKPLLKRMKDRSEKCRESAVKILRSLVENTSDLAAALPYIFPSLVARLGSEDLDGVAHLPEIMRPDPEQKPTEIAQPVEDSEEVRLQLGHFVASLLSRCSPTQIYSYIDEATGLIRAAAMDPFHEVKALACETMISFCYNHTEMLLHFALPLARSLTSCLTHNHAKLRIAGLRAVTACLWCGIWKHNFEIFQVLMAWQDPNKVPIKAFYEGVTNVNYMSTLSFDRHPAVRRFWFETLAYWMLRCVDKVDLEPYIAPYLLTGLCDENEEIALEVFWLIEKIGEAYEAEHEEDLRKTKQYGFDYQWTYNGRASVPFPLQGVWNGAGRSASSAVRRSGARGPDLLGQKALTDHHHRELLDEEEAEEEGPLGSPLELPRRDYGWNELRHLEVFRKLPRPRLGSRSWVRTHTRRYIKATFNDVVDFRDCTALNAGRLLCMSVAYTEEGVTEWLQPMLQALTKFYSGRAWAAGDTRAMQTYGAVCKLLGAFLEPAALWAQLRPALDADCALELDQRVASMRILAMCLEGHVAVLQSICPPDPSVRMGQLEPVIPELIEESLQLRRNESTYFQRRNGERKLGAGAEAMHNSDLLLSPTPESREAGGGEEDAFGAASAPRSSVGSRAKVAHVCRGDADTKRHVGEADVLAVWTLTIALFAGDVDGTLLLFGALETAERALLILGVVDLLGALRTVDEVESRVPAVILTELRSANAEVSDHVKMLEDANAAAEQKKEASKKKIDEKVKVMQELQKKTHALEAKASKSRELMLRVEKAQTEHTEKGQEHAKSIEKFKDLSDEMESVARKVLLKEQALRQIVKTLKRQIAALRAELDALRTTREAAEVEMQTLKSQALSAGQLKEGAEQEQAKVEEAMQTAKKELQAMQAQLNVAVSAATVAEAQEEEATNRAREAARKRDDARQTQALLKKLRQKVKLYYESVEEVEMASPAKDLKQLPETKVAGTRLPCASSGR
ncbi:unnamed protein product [Durusdinium trenchii]|uniref:HEAT repeat-containing protein n=1 Tax=Durusdinium trenchii TaxID=1381693 RepID=A0ABP0M9D7_9DINO